MEMDYVVKMQFGSHIYGTNVATSDYDYKAIYLPSAKDLVLQRPKDTINQTTKEDKNAKNQAGDIDLEIFSLQKYVDLLLEGQTVAMDILFTPESFWQERSQFWDVIQENRNKFLHSGYSAFAGYCRTQANKYGIKGSRISSLRKAIEFLQTLPNQQTKLNLYMASDQPLPEGLQGEYISIVMINGPKGVPEPHLEVVNRKIPFHATVKYALEIYQRIFDKYGHRALLAEKHEGIDWKALMHAVRICNQSQELLKTGNIIFPRPEKEILLKIRKGELPYKEVAEMIEVGLELMEQTALTSTLPKEPDKEFAEQLVYDAYKFQLLRGF